MPVADFGCPSCGYYEDTLIYKVGAKPACPECATALKRDYSRPLNLHIKGDGYGSFTPIDLGPDFGLCDTKDKFDAAWSKIQAKHPGAVLTRETDAQKRVRLDEARHRSALAKKAKGVDDKAINEVKAEQRKALRMGGDAIVHQSPNHLLSPTNNPESANPRHLEGGRTKLHNKAKVLS